jgi:hypothetical protein
LRDVFGSNSMKLIFVFTAGMSLRMWLPTFPSVSFMKICWRKCSPPSRLRLTPFLLSSWVAYALDILYILACLYTSSKDRSLKPYTTFESSGELFKCKFQGWPQKGYIWLSVKGTAFFRGYLHVQPGVGTTVMGPYCIYCRHLLFF